MLNPISPDKLEFFEKNVFGILRDDPPSVLNTTFTLEDHAMAAIIKRCTEVYNRILTERETITEKHLAIVSTIVSLVCEKALLEKVIQSRIDENSSQKES
jgi:hypothetical protein